ncbi:MAG: hypothetical protein HZB79_08885, partial [Deltaproteobacteria bacterium]|nr:hypothetical protein [Deltaproteobacteria bacterium]
MNRHSLNIVFTSLFLFIFLFVGASYSYAMGDFDEQKPAPPSPEQTQKKKDVDKIAFKENIRKSLATIKTYLNLEKSGQFDSNFTTSAAMFASTEFMSPSNLKANSKVIAPDMANEAYWYARYNIEALTLQSGMGVHLGYSKIMEKESLDNRINTIVKKTG